MDDVMRARRRVRDYWFTDGFAEIAGGSAVALSSGLMLTSLATGSDLLAKIAIAVLLASAAGGAILVKVAKSRVTYPRTGRVTESARSRIGRLVGTVLWVCAVIPLLAAWERSTAFSAAVLILATGVATGAALAWVAYRRGDVSLYVAAAACAVTGFAAALAGASGPMGIVLVFLAAGVCGVVTGGLSLARYLAANPLPTSSTTP